METDRLVPEQTTYSTKGTDDLKANSSDKTTLEQRYMRLLELRVAQLEAIVGEGEGKVRANRSSDTLARYY